MEKGRGSGRAACAIFFLHAFFVKSLPFLMIFYAFSQVFAQFLAFFHIFFVLIFHARSFASAIL